MVGRSRRAVGRRGWGEVAEGVVTDGGRGRNRGSGGREERGGRRSLLDLSPLPEYLANDCLCVCVSSL